MSTKKFEAEVLKRLDRMERMLRRLLQDLEDGILSAREELLVDQALKEANKGKLLSKEQVFGKAR